MDLSELDLDAARAAIAAATSAAELGELRRGLVGKGSVAARARESIKDLDPSERPAFGRAVTDFTKSVEAALADAELALTPVASAEPPLDLTLGGHGRRVGSYSLVTQAERELQDIFVSLGYRVAEGPEVEDDWHNFEALNFPPGHPARAMQDTLYVDLGEPEQVLLRTHTSPVQIRLMESTPPPIYAVITGRTYRNETVDARHSAVFHQIEGLAVDRGLTFGDLAGTIEAFISAYFRTHVTSRLLPSFFPFTEPSAEFAISCVFCDGAGCRVCSKTGWIELGGCGMVDPNVFEAVGIDPEEYTGFAFGFGIERMPMLRYNVQPIKTFFDNDDRFLSRY
jgi:phenylalanyl-tRNA synthetase alpha chain